MTLTNEQKIQARHDLAKLEGLPPYDNWSNICCGDGYYANSLIRRYGMDLIKLGVECGYRDLVDKYNSKKRKLDKKFKKAMLK